MLFNSIDFAVFLPIVFALYWFLPFPNTNTQNVFLIISSYIFYGWWDWRFLFLIIISSSVDFYIGTILAKTLEKARRKLLISISIIVNIGILFVFKYYNFFISSFIGAFSLFGVNIDSQGLNIILPVGISFYTFQTLSYSIDVYKNKIAPTNNPTSFFSFVAFFPQLVAGPIERAINLLPQFGEKRVFKYDMAVDGMRQILWGLFKKIVIADNCAIYVNDIFENYNNLPGSILLLGACLFSFQIYGDFSGYSDIAIGTSRLFGFKLSRNFSFPYFSRDIAEFWRRWHISLSTWFRDYIYIPLGGSRGGKWLITRNTFATFILSGLWHGANWTFVIWAIINALYFLPLVLRGKNKKNMGSVAEGQLWPSFDEIRQVVCTFFLISFAWIFFRSESLIQAINYIDRIMSWSIFSWSPDIPYHLIGLIFLFAVVEWLQRDKQHVLELNTLKVPKTICWLIYYGLGIMIFLFGGRQQDFIYFQF